MWKNKITAAIAAAAVITVLTGALTGCDTRPGAAEENINQAAQQGDWIYYSNYSDEQRL
jgi:hypothetical protein